ncbi:MAG: response regulator [Candidatus Omnitrophica bacterium]|nr:response regulator [Candidatus Omnitrophota bacterium]MCB9719518.1 response regulator [Candidatus Omnitrophota bacterium]
MWKILIAEDNPADAHRLMQGLSQVAHCVLAKDGIETLSIYRESVESGSAFDFILLDVKLPKKDGFDVLKTIRNGEESVDLPRSREAKVIMTTTYRDSLMENYNMGWDDFITKPVDADILTKRLRELEIESKKSD